MSNVIHPTAVIGPNVELADDIYIGPYCTIGLPDFQTVKGLSAEEINTIVWPKTTIGSGARIFHGASIGIDSKIGKNLRMDANGYIGSSCTLGDEVTVEYGARIYNEATIGSRCTIGGFVCNKSIIGEDCNIQGSLIHPRRTTGIEPPPSIANQSFVGTNALVIGGHTISEGCFVAAGAIVTKSTKKNKLYIGAPAKEAGPSFPWISNQACREGDEKC